MANYDTPGLFYDSGVLYDSVPAPQPPRTMTAKIKTNLANLNVAQKTALANTAKTALTGNAHFPTTNPTLASYGTTTTTMANDYAAYLASAAATKALLITALASEKLWDQATNQLVQSLENTANGNAVFLGTTGFPLRSAPAPVGVPPQVTNLSATAGDNQGEIDLHWDPVHGAKSYVIMVSPDPITPTSWVPRTPVSKSKAAITGLNSGDLMWFKVQCIGANPTPGAFSDPAMKIVP